jgi:hypothetical protein
MSVNARQPRRKAPWWASAFLAAAVGLQIALAAVQPGPIARASALPSGPSAASAAWLQTFDRLPAAHLLVLYLQAFDNQPGVSIPYRDLDYERVAQWLRASLRLDPESQYPLLMAAQLYAQVPDPARSRAMLGFLYEQYLLDPGRRWRWLAHGAIMAKHRLHDLPLALRYAGAIAEHSPGAPSWARQMRIFILEDMGEYEAARILLGGLLASGLVTDRHEQILLQESLERIQAAEKSAGPTKPRRAGGP